MDPTGLKQNIFQKALTGILNLASKIEPVKEFIQKNTSIEIKRDVYEGLDTTDNAGNPNGTYFKDNMSVKVGPIPLNSVQVQSTPDVEGATPLSEGEHTGKLGVDGATNPYVEDAIQVDDSGYFVHDNWRDGAKPYSQGCPMTSDHADMTETKDILRKDLGIQNGDNVKINITENKGKTDNENIKK